MSYQKFFPKFTKISLKNLIAIFYLFVIWYVYNLDIFFSTSSYITFNDSIDQSYMWLNKVFNSIKRNEIAFWDFTIFSGTSFIGELQTGSLYPIALLYGKFFSNIDIFISLHLMICSLGAFYLARTLKLKLFSSLIFSLLFTYSGYYPSVLNGQLNIFASNSYIPLGIGLMIKTINSEDIKKIIFYSILTSIIFSIMFTAGHTYALIIAFFSGLLLSIAIFLFENNYSKIKLFAVSKILYIFFIIFIFSFIFLNLTQLISFFEYFMLSYKWHQSGYTSFPHIVPSESIYSSALRIDDFISFIKPKIFIGEGFNLFLTYPGLIIFIFFLILYPLSVNFPHKRKLIICFGILTVLIIFSLGFFYTHIPILNQIRVPYRWGIVISLFIFLILSIASEFLYFFTSKKINKKIVFIIFLIITNLIAFIPYNDFKKFTHKPSVKNNEAFEPLKKKYVRFLQDKMKSENNIYRFYSKRQLYPPNLGNLEFNLSIHGYRSSRTKKFHDTFDFNPFSNSSKKFSVKYWVSDKKIDNLNLIWEDKDLFIYEQSDVLKVLWYKTKEKNKELSPLINNIEWSGNKVKFELDEEISGRIYFSQSFYPGFIAYNSQEKFNVIESDNLISINVTKPIKDIYFEYRPFWLFPSIFISFTYLLFLIIILFFNNFIFRKFYKVN